MTRDEAMLVTEEIIIAMKKIVDNPATTPMERIEAAKVIVDLLTKEQP